MTLPSRPRLILVHGAWVGPWEFGPLLAILRKRDWSVTAVGLPSTASTRGIEDDAAAINAAIDAEPGPVILLGQSYGGVPITLAGDHPRVEHLVYVCAFALDAHESAQGSMGGELPEWWGIQDGQVTMGRSREERVAMIAADLPPEATPAAEGMADLFLPRRTVRSRNPSPGPRGACGRRRTSSARRTESSHPLSKNVSPHA